MKFTACCMMFSAGCQATDRLTNWSHKDEIANAAASEQLASRIEKSSPGLNAQVAQNQPTKSVEEHIRLGQVEVSEWYRDKATLRLMTARSHFESALSMAPQSSSAHHGLAIIADLEKNYSEAERHYQQALIQNPTNSDILGDMGYSYLLQNRLSESEQYSLRAVQANPNNTNALKHLGDAYARQGKTQLATETYAKVYSPDGVQAALAENSPSTQKPPLEPLVKTNPTLFDRIVPGKSKGERLAADIQQRHQAYEEQAKRQANANSRGNLPPNHAQRRLAQEAMLRQQMQDIDNEAIANHQGGPLLLDEQTGQMTRLPGAENQQSWRQETAVANSFSSMELYPSPGMNQRTDRPQNYQPQANGVSQNGPYFDEMPQDRGMQMAGGQYPPQQQAYSPQYGDPQQQSAGPAAYGNPSPYGNQPQYPQVEQAPRQQFPQRVPNSIQEPWNGIQQTAAQAVDSHPADADSRLVNHAYQQVPAGQPPEIVLANGQTNPNPTMQGFQGNPGNQYGTQPNGFGAMPPQGPSGQFGMPANNPSTFQSGSIPGHLQPGVPQQGPPQMAQGGNYQEASRAAARMGMGVGPGGMFPVVQQNQATQTPVMNPPGSMTYNTPGPMRWMPDGGPAQNLNNAFQPYPNPVPSPPTTQGQTPPQITPTYSVDQFGTASRYDTRTLENSNIPSDLNQSLQDYETQRWVAGREANMAVQQIWNQGPINTPLSPSAGSQYTNPSQQGMMYTPNAPTANGRGHVPEQWPNAPVTGPGDVRQAGDQPRIMYQGPNSASMNGSNGDLNSVQSDFNRYDNRQYSAGTQMPGQNGLSRPNPNPQRPQGDVVVPAEYRPSARRQPEPQNGNTAAGDQSSWPTIIPASR
ncbi:tetratricopeptide repeat protein [Planctomicrobium sp. SH661]|uniref:tetratricopeptide repeat protein n=1 Tax=Planctomicrobium sp. SH661 TaxID=3448124 RepID=UPI003F5B09C7